MNTHVHQHKSLCRLFPFAAALRVLFMGIVLTPTRADDQTEILKITVGDPTRLSDTVYQNTANLMVSHTGVVAAFYPKFGTGPHFYRISNDAGLTWSREMNGPPELNGGADSGTLDDGDVIMPAGETRPASNGKDGWYEKDFLRFTSNFKRWKLEIALMHIPAAGPVALDHIAFPTFAKGKMVQLPNGDVLVPAYSSFKGDSSRRLRAYMLRSQDKGHTWYYYATIANEPTDPSPELPGQYLGACEPSITLLANGRMLAMLRTQYAHPPAEYKPMAVCWSDDQGTTWTQPVATRPHLMCISPTLATLDNGVVACEYGRPGFHVVFSLDNGHTWQDRISFSHQIEPSLTGQFDMIKAGPNDLIAIGSDADGVKVWPISVERVAVASGSVTLVGRIVDDQGHPIAGALVECAPNRYSAEDWVVDPLGWSKRVRRGNSHPERTVPKEYLPRLSYRSIRKTNGYPTAHTNELGQYLIKDVDLGEYVVTVEANGYASQHRRVKINPRSNSEDFSLTPGRHVRGRVVDSAGQPIGGVCLVVNQWHCHTDPLGYFHWSVAAPVPQRVTLYVDRKYSHQYETLETTVALTHLESQPITLKNR
jgi:hypothetical protein